MSTTEKIDLGDIARELRLLCEQEAVILRRRREILDLLQKIAATATSLESTAADRECQTISGQNPVLGKSVGELGLSEKLRRIFREERIYTIRDVVIRTRGELRKSPGLGDTSADEVEDALRELGLTLGMRIIS